MRARLSAVPLAAGVAVAAVAGALVGTLGAFKHQAGVDPGTGAGVPYGLLCALAMVAAVLAALRVGFRSRLYAAAAGVGVVVADGVFALKGPGGSQVVVGDVEGIVWMVAPVLIAAAAVLIPARRRGREPLSGADGILEADGTEEDPAP